MKPLCVELFAGSFGWSAGWLELGGRAIGFDIEHLEHHGPVPEGANLVIQDVLTLHGRQFKDAALIVASPPCQFFSYCAMPWSRARKLAAEVRADPVKLKKELFLFNACFRIQREAVAAAGHFIPMVVENVCGAQPWVGRSKANFGSYHLWGDVPALMPITQPRRKSKVGSWDQTRANYNPNHAWDEGLKLPGKNSAHRWDEREVQRLCDATKVASEDGRRTDVGNGVRFTSRDCGMEAEGVKGFTPNGEPLGKNQLGRKHGSKSSARKAASAQIARIPLPLSRWIAKVYYP